MAEAEVKEYQKVTKTGQTVTVKAHNRSNEGAAAQALARPGRPPIAARQGTFPNGRSIPGIFVAPTPEVEGTEAPPQPLSNPDEHGEFGKKLPDHLRALIEPEFDAKTGKPLKKTEPSKKTQNVVAAAAALFLADENVLMLAGDDES